MTRNQTVRGTPASDDIRASAQGLVDRLGDREAARVLGVTRATLARALAGLPMLEATHALLRERLGKAGRADQGARP